MKQWAGVAALTGILLGGAVLASNAQTQMADNNRNWTLYCYSHRGLIHNADSQKRQCFVRGRPIVVKV